MHRYCHRELQQNDNIDISVSQQRSCAKQITSQLKAYLGAIQGQEIPTQFLVHKRQTESGQSPTADNKCCICKINIGDVNHIISSCQKCQSSPSSWCFSKMHPEYNHNKESYKWEIPWFKWIRICKEKWRKGILEKHFHQNSN